MIITITGKPCSGKGTVSKIFCKKFGFEYICTGDMFRELAKSYGYDDVLEFQKDEVCKNADKIVDNKTAELGKTSIDKNIVVDSRLAWHFIPNSFKVFIDIDWQTAGERLLSANRANEKAKEIKSAVQKLKDRWQEENQRYLELYNTNNFNLSNYNLVISSQNKTPEEIADIIYNEYKNFMVNKTEH